jgi:hypothetical protein
MLSSCCQGNTDDIPATSSEKGSSLAEKSSVPPAEADGAATMYWAIAIHKSTSPAMPKVIKVSDNMQPTTRTQRFSTSLPYQGIAISLNRLVPR